MELQQPVKVMVLAKSVMLQTTSVNAARWMRVCHPKRAMMEPVLVINYLIFV